MKMLHLVLILLTLSGVLSQSSDWGVKYPDKPICAVRGFSVSIPCSYSYPKSNPNIQVTQMLWCSMNSNREKCTHPPYVYDSSSSTKSDFEYAGDDKSNCTLLIHNLQFSYSGEYKFRFITVQPSDRYTGDPGVTLQVADLKVSLIRLSGNGTLKQGDSLNLTCDVNCPHSSSQFVWSKNNEQLNTSGPVLHFPALTVRDSGNYTCIWKTNETSGSETVSLQVEGVLTQSSGWGVKYPEPVCAVRGFNVSIPCYYWYPQNYRVVQMLWCSMNSNRDVCTDPPYVYNSSSNIKSDFEYVGDNKSDCTLLINNVQFNYSGTYKFRFITNVIDGKWTGLPGVILQVADLKVSLIRLSGNGTLKQGDSLNLTCDVNCTHSSSQFVWSKNNERLPASGPVLHFPALTVRDSGSYTCTWETNETSGSETISLQVKGENPDHGSILIIAVVTAAVIFIILVLLGAVIYNRRRKDDVPEDNSRIVGEQSQVKQVPQPNGEVSQEEEVTYASVCVKDTNPNNGNVHTEQQNEDISVIYSTVTIK
ncbi:carcinoembryonic antigen-related cell adhesion molecule 2-like [Pangasianodon hypophthalmus]|uniref:carcinoembryonic antigen-related cell adhesion molecule 2-like n=1 Tax=Pangasianodon hypophthalmus TaxID=310915 RepID=UPI002307EAC6|nr:carcinoembryonic antigen-related cell adhesion molecule 2-like [Pangasianodon hypophthalmus]